jgi:hypothetical protein
MNKTTAFFVAFLTSSLAAGAQDVFENKNAPLSPNAGRIVTLKEEMRIEDTGEKFFFKNPYTIRVSPPGNLLILDEEQALT